MSNDEWWALRDIVWEAAEPNAITVLDNAPDRPAVDLVRQFFATNDATLLNRAALLIALAKPGIDHKVAEASPWLVIEKN